MDIPIPWLALFDHTSCVATKLPPSHSCHSITCSRDYYASPASRKELYVTLGEFIEGSIVNHESDLPTPQTRSYLVRWAGNLIRRSHRDQCIDDVVDAFLDCIAMILSYDAPTTLKKYRDYGPMNLVEELFLLDHHLLDLGCDGQHAARRALDNCLICQVSLEPANLALDFTVWCRCCGTNYHRDCWEIWVENLERANIARGVDFTEDLLCALCRGIWFGECEHELEEPAGWRSCVKPMLQGEPRWKRVLDAEPKRSATHASTSPSASRLTSGTISSTKLSGTRSTLLRLGSKSMEVDEE